MNEKSKIYIAGHHGLVGSAIVRQLTMLGYKNLVTYTRSECDLLDARQVTAMFQREQPEYVFLAAAKVGGIFANQEYPVDFLEQNLTIQLNIIRESYHVQVKRLLFLGSSCIYPRDCPQPIKEEYLLSGALELTNRPYAIAKIAGIEQCWSYNRQYKTQYLAAMPTNLYGANDNFDLLSSHVLPALIRKMHEAKITNQNKVMLWGSGTPKREFLYVDDLADACVFLMNLPPKEYAELVASSQQPPLINLGFGEDIAIADLAQLVKEVVGFQGEIYWDRSKPDGTPRKLMNSGKLRQLGWVPQVQLKEGIARTYAYYLTRVN